MPLAIATAKTTTAATKPMIPSWSRSPRYEFSGRSEMNG